MDTRLGDLHGILALCDRIADIFREERVVGKRVYHPHTLADFDADPRSGVVLIWRLNYYDSHESREGEFLPLQLEVSLWSDEGSNSQELIQFLFTLRDSSEDNSYRWSVNLTFAIDKFQSVRNLIFGWALERGAHALYESKAFEFIRSLAAFYAKLPAAETAITVGG